MVLDKVLENSTSYNSYQGLIYVRRDSSQPLRLEVSVRRTPSHERNASCIHTAVVGSDRTSGPGRAGAPSLVQNHGRAGESRPHHRDRREARHHHSSTKGRRKRKVDRGEQLRSGINSEIQMSAKKSSRFRKSSPHPIGNIRRNPPNT